MFILLGIFVTVLGVLLTTLCIWTVQDPFAVIRFDKRVCGVDYSPMITDRRRFVRFRRMQAGVAMVFAVGLVAVGLFLTGMAVTYGDPDAHRRQNLEFQRQMMQPSEFERKRADEAWRRFMNNPNNGRMDPATKPRNDPAPAGSR